MALARGYTGPECPRCGGYVDLERMSAGEQRCVTCNAVFLATPFQPPVVRVRVGSIAEAGPEGAMPCARHSGNAAIGNCTRCGVFMCDLCKIEIEGQELCPSCFDRLSAEGELSSVQTRMRDFRGLALSFSVLGCLFSCFGLITGPLTFYLIAQAVRQRRLRNESGGIPALLTACLLAVAQILISIFVIVSLFATLKP